MERLLQLGFVPVGQWLLQAEDNLQFDINAHQNANNILYSFVSNGAIKYIGKTTGTLNRRMNGFRSPGLSQRTNIRVNELLATILQENQPVEILVFIDNEDISYRGYRVNLSAGLEDSLIQELRPQWNIAGITPYDTDANLEVTQPAHAMVPDAPTVILTLNKTYYNQGFFNVGVEHEYLLGNHGEPIQIRMGNNVIQGHINRTANRNGTPRIMGGTQMKSWIQRRFRQGANLLVDVNSPMSIELW